MVKAKYAEKIKVIVVNPPTKEKADERLKALAAHLGKTWKPVHKKKL